MNYFTEGIRWHYISDAGRVLLKRLEEKPADIQRIKQSRNRHVFRLIEHGVYVKQIRYDGLRRVVKTVSGGNAVKEGRIALKILQKGIAVPEVLAFGTKTAGGILLSDILITREIANGKSLFDYISNEYNIINYNNKCIALKEFARFLNKIHDAGIFHRDFHLKNLIIQKQEGTLRFFVLDLDKVSFRPGPLPWEKRAKQLGILFSISWGLCSRNHYFRFLKEYGINIRQKEIKCLIGLVRKHAVHHLHHLLSQRSRQSIKANTRFDCKTIDGFKVYHPWKPSEKLQELKIKHFVSQISQWENSVGEKKQGGESLRKPDGNGHDWIIKRYGASGVWHRLKALWVSAGRQVWKKIWRFPFNNVTVVHPMMMLERNRSYCNKKAYVVFKSPENAIPLHSFWNVINEVDKKELCAKLGIIIGKMHGMGCLHGNLNWQNILICRTQRNDDILMTGIDHAGLNRRLCPSRAKQDLAPFLGDMDRFCGEEKDRAFFLRCWEKWAGM